ncbi:unnamed protein product [Spirodela intermedia]|uniref:SBP-type domain-containing protein n=1 Tax=Spirodela intermedia TaxID=51605 RepID=A0A7I8LFX5_SPIIN|nr:unnamed protein product [Spirodela intermedia]
MGAYDPPPRIMSFVGLESGGRGGGDRNEKQQHLWDWEPSVHPSSEIAHYYQFPPFFESAAIPNASFYDCAASSFPPLAAASSTTGGGCPLYSVVPGDYRGGPVKHEDDWGAGGIGLNLGHRMYFPTSDALGVERLFQRSTAIYQVSTHVPQCQVEGCKADLTRAKNYHRRHKVCEFHSKSAVVIIGGMHQRFCQQCSR